MAVTTRAVKSGDFFAWLDLFIAYGEYYESRVTDETALVVWSWLENSEHPMRGLVAETENGDLVGFTHFRTFARPLHADHGLQIDDLFVTSEQRRRGTGNALLEGVRELARAERAGVVRWITADDEGEAQQLSEHVASRTSSVVYDLAP
jgi:GNAT superfamily N-acetyltransferase